MKLSEAIRLGSMLHPQCFGSSVQYRDGEGLNIAGTCALGAAYEAGYRHVEVGYTPADAVCPACHRVYTLNGTIAHLNDYHRWTRERIADWVATVEPTEVCESPVTEDAVSPIEA